MYLITNLNNGMMYSGSHLLYERGVFPDGYWNSSRNSEFINLFYGMKPMFKYEIVDSGDHAEMKNRERDFHKKEDVMHNPLFYNLANAGGAYVVPVRGELCKHIVQKLKDGEFRTKDPERVEDLNKLKKLQVRFEVKPVGEIVNKMREKGDASNAEPVLVWEVEGGDIIGDGNRTLEAATKAKIPVVNTNRIPESFSKEHDINQDEMDRVGQLLNPVPEIEKDPTDDETIITTLLKYNRDHGTPFNAPSNKEYISDLGLSHQKATYLIGKAKDKKDDEDAEKIGKTVIRYDDVDDPIIQKEIAKLEDDHTIVISGSAGSGIRLFANTIDAMEEKPNWQRLICKPYYGTDKIRKQWEGHWKIDPKTKKRTKIAGYRDDYERRISYVMALEPENSEGIPRSYSIDKMPHLQDEITQSDR